MIDFARPWMLIGLLAAFIPVVLHLLGRRKAPRVAFTALAFLMEGDPHRARALRLRERALLAVRSLVMALLAIALSKPLVPALDDEGATIAGRGPVSAVIVLDDSMSMMARTPGGETRFELARRRVQRMIERLPLGSSAAVVAAGYPARAVHRRLSVDLRSVAADVRRLPHHPRRDDAARALALAEQLLSTATTRERVALVVTDMQAGGWGAVASPWEADPPRDRPPVRLQVERIDAAAPTNTSLIDARAEPAPERGPQQVRVQVDIAHQGEAAFRDYVTVRAGEREVKSWIEIQPGETVRRTFVLPATSDTAEVFLPSDGLEADNRRLVRLSGGDVARVALINGAPRPVPREDEVFFAERALKIGAERVGAVAVDVLAPERIDGETLGRYDAMVLANVAELTPLQEREIGELVDRGAGLLITSGEAAQERLDGWLTTLLPHPVAGEQVLDPEQGGGSGRKPQQLQVVPPDEGSPPAAVRALRERLAALVMPALEGAQVQRYLLVRPSAAVGRHVVLRTLDGAPALLLAPRGQGLVAWLTTSVDRDWNNLPLQPGFLPLLHEVVSALAGREVAGQQTGIEPGGTAVLARHQEAQSLVVRRATASGASEVVRELRGVDAGARVWKIDGLLEPGRYLAREEGEGSRWSERTLVVVPPALESDLTAMPSVGLLRSEVTPGAGAASRRPMVPAWSFALLLLFGLLLLEAALLLRGTGRLPRAPQTGYQERAGGPSVP